MLRIFIENLGKRNEGDMVGMWVDLPADFDQVLEKIGISDEPDENGNYYEEYIITDFESDIQGVYVSEYADLEELNEIAEQLESLDDTEKEVIAAYLNNYSNDFDKALECVTNNDYTIYPNCYSMGDVAAEYCEECGILDSIPENLRSYFDYDAFGRDMDLEGSFYYSSEIGGYIELIA